MDALTSPLFDVVTARQRNMLYTQEYNSIHLSVPKDEDIKQSKTRLGIWKQNRILVQDEVPCIYVYYQYFSILGSENVFCRKGFIANIRIHDWSENIILRHENTMPFSVDDRLAMLKAMQLNVSPTHGLYTDSEKEIEHYLDESMKAPIYETEDYQGVRDVMSIISDRKIINRIQQILKDKQIILADGHHRYESSLKHQQFQMQNNPDHSGNEGYNFHMMYLTNTESDDLNVLPTHRLVKDLENFSEDWLLNALTEDFIIKVVENAPDVNEIIQGKQWAFGLLIGDNAYKIRLKPERINDLKWKFPTSIKRLDLTVMHYFIFEKILRIKGKDQSNTKKITYQRNFTECLREVIKGEAQFAVITKGISIDTIKEVCYSGYTLPQKSTYFYPKVISGFVFSSIDENEFYSPFDSCFQ